jgi:exodeoxyribonuclease V alpha subunit
MLEYNFITHSPKMVFRQFFQEELYQTLLSKALEGHLCIRAHAASSSFVGDPSQGTPIIRDGNRLYLHRNWMVETILLTQFRRLLRSIPQPLSLRPPRGLSPEQEAVVQWAATHTLTIVRGGPGTGKTTTAVQLIQAFPSLRVKIAAPTGKAADRLARALPPGEYDCEASTLHRLLQVSPGKNRLFEENLIEADLILVDEASMIDAALFAHLFSAIPEGARLVLLGDPDQLPPVQGGGVFADLCTLSSLSLQQCHRTQTLQTVYEATRRGEVDPLLILLEPMPSDPIVWILQATGTVLSPLRKGPFGVDALNREVLQRRGKEGAPVLITGNNPRLDLYNGTEGIIKGQEVLFPDGRSLPIAQLPEYEYAFALSIHKSQGNEYEDILCLLPPGSEEFGRKALYTAVTRAKRSIRLFGSKETLERMMSNETRQENGVCERFRTLCSSE